ncbi:hypothetical protein CPB84DRAFT_1850670 [Gymnopilus junonius]|uniref:Fe2OG dioxygenase domain-containing protein n=1 Tax=Gymnopilus junonius TaxID=109634 RepID=A0A9P5NG28_GYMJU|nr:hypothetical protein CPB84DRAFT_1850670 [Gymnopilus junonius]
MGKNSKKRKQPPTPSSSDVADRYGHGSNSNSRLFSAVKKLKRDPGLAGPASAAAVTNANAKGKASFAGLGSTRITDADATGSGQDSDEATLAPPTPPKTTGEIAFSRSLDTDVDAQAAEDGEGGKMIGGVIFEDELETTTDTLRLLAQNPSLIGLKALKPFKTAVHDYWRIANEVGNIGHSLTSRISSALIDQRHTDALRWVRECDAVLTPSMSQEEENRVWHVLDAILRTTQPEMVVKRKDKGKEGSSRCIEDEDEGELKPGTRLRWFKPFSVDPGPATSHPSQNGDDDVLDPDKISSSAASLLQPLQTTPGAERRPPKNTLSLSTSPCRLTRPPFPSSPNPNAPGSPADTPSPESQAHCHQRRAGSDRVRFCSLTAEKMGMAPDEPVAGSATQLASVLAHNLVWVADEEFVNGLYERIEGLLPPEVNGGKVKGINRRFRVYRYRPGALYRPHIDGAWPASSIHTTSPTPSSSSSPTHSYIYDSDPTTYSRLTLLIYLNDGFTGGHTTFFLPSSTPGILEARPVQPRTGTVCVFPHGAARGSLLHEGSGVLEGAKYVIRTEILYEVDERERVDAAQGGALPGPMSVIGLQRADRSKSNLALELRNKSLCSATRWSGWQSNNLIASTLTPQRLKPQAFKP